MRAAVLLVSLVVPLAASPGAASAQTDERRIVVVAPSADDARIEFTRAAIGFWNRTLSELGLEVRFREAAVVVEAAEERAIETFARFVSQRGGRIPRGANGPTPPEALAALDGDLVVLLSRQPLLPFAWPLPGRPGYLVAIRQPEARLPGDDRVLRNVIAHELGHTLGLSHHRTSFTLMCAPCSSVAAADPSLEWLPLTGLDRARLREIHAN